MCTYVMWYFFYCRLDCNCVVVSCIYAFSLPHFICDCWCFVSFIQEQFFLCICVYATVLFIKEEEEEEVEEEEYPFFLRAH